MVFRRRRRDDDAAPVDAAEVTDAAVDGAAEKPRPGGPFDAPEIGLDEARQNRIDLGGIMVRGTEGMKIQLQVDKRTGRGTSALLAVGDAAVQLVAVAAPRTSGMWEQTRLEITADAERRGGTVQEGSGPFGTEVRVVLPVKTKDGKQGRQASRISGIDGPRWMLRATFLGKAITDANVFQRLVELVRQVVVVRGDAPMPPGEVIALRPPARAEATEDGPTITDTATDMADEEAPGTVPDGDPGPGPGPSQ